MFSKYTAVCLLDVLPRKRGALPVPPSLSATPLYDYLGVYATFGVIWAVAVGCHALIKHRWRTRGRARVKTVVNSSSSEKGKL